MSVNRGSSVGGLEVVDGTSVGWAGIAALPPHEAGDALLLEGDMQAGTDNLLLEGDMQSGTDILLLEPEQRSP